VQLILHYPEVLLLGPRAPGAQTGAKGEQIVVEEGAEALEGVVLVEVEEDKGKDH